MTLESPRRDTRPLTFTNDIRPLFTDRDVIAMRDFFDLSRYEDVRAHAEEIYRRVEDGSMPCYAMWPTDKVERLRSWIDAGMPR